MATNRVNVGDTTGRERASAVKAASQLAAEEANTRLIESHEVTEEERNGVFDPQSQERLNGVSKAEVVHDVSPVIEPRRGFGKSDEAAEEVFTGYESPEEIAPALAARSTPRASDPHMVSSSQVTIRVDYDIDDMTYGMKPNGEPNNFTFKEGLAYRVPLAVAQHLDERGLIRQWVSK